MSDGLSDALKDFWKASDKADKDIQPYPLFTDEEIDKMVEGFEAPTIPWLDLASWAPKSYECDCGGKKAKTTHVEWCSSRKL